MLDLTINEQGLEKAVACAREKNIIIPTLEQMCNPDSIPDAIKEKLGDLGLWDLDPLNLFRITWKNESKEKGGTYTGVNHIELPSSLTGVPARIVMLVGKWFPTGAHKVGAAFGCLAPRLVTGQFDPSSQKAVWPSTGNYCRGGAYDSNLLGCESIAILPEGMSQERFDWLANVAGEVIKTPGSESNVKEIFDKCWELRQSGDDIMIFNQFDDMGNYLWHYTVTGRAMTELVNELSDDPNKRFKGVILSTGSGGTLASGDYLKQQFPNVKIGACEALQCPTLLNNGFGDHRIEGIGDKHIPWVHNVRHTDMAIAIDDEVPMNLIRLFNDPMGVQALKDSGVPAEIADNLHLMGISSVANMVSAIKFAKYYELGEEDVVLSVATDSMDMYQSRLVEMNEERGAYTATDAAYSRAVLDSVTLDNMQELSHYDRKRIHNLKYYTWIEQQGMTFEEIQAQWYDEEYWENIQKLAPKVDELINAFNKKTGLLDGIQE
ncbi:pyridoxal-phosphate dependent enzyme [Pseudodesulfovibrio sediminis]|uniref:Pyridoxal-5'-phosphate-dependent protein subunit beta n=1 Tax=Pseudodesulfovibrio sediminis TaxID=2810563 RepID=A0ABM7P952_9BACT|nr:pyridoxal-phosphate dependent enzyme [Pseudodesulfovibrio sediminis]BCS89574.1 pyridoxal-5'-phosphate-dependent protein subunit beta [Pseudodesulfovibrio sediminis]